MLKNMLSNAFQAHQKGDVDMARALYQSILSQDPNFADALHLLGILEMQTGDTNAAIIRLYEATAQQPENPAFWRNLGNALRAAGRWAEAQSAWKKALYIQPGDADLLANIGISLLALGKRDEAASMWNQALSHNADHIESLINLGMLRREDDECSVAHDLWSRALTLDSNNLKVQKLLAEVKGEMGIQALANKDLKKARRMLLAATELQDDDARNWAYLAEFQLASKKYKKAFEACKRAISLVPEKPEYHHTMGNIFRMIGQNDSALEAYRRAKNLGATHPATYRAIAELTGEQVAEDPQLVRQLFNQYADSFDQDLQNNLEYSTPLVAYQVFQKSPAKITVQSVLDLGCGTGLSIEPFHKEGLRGVGVDISEKMLEQAKEKGLYDSLHCSEIGSYLEQEKQSYDLVLCLDTLVYIQDLQGILREVHRCIYEGGLFLCSTEKGSGSKPILQPSGRYAHPQRYFENLADNLGWTVIHREEANLRKDGDIWIQGNIWLLQA